MREIFSQWAHSSQTRRAHSPKLKPMAGLAHAERKTRANSARNAEVPSRQTVNGYAPAVRRIQGNSAKTAENQDNNIKKSLKKDGFTPSFL